MLHDHRTTKYACPWCGQVNDAAAGPETPPAPGDIGICIGCSSPYIFGPNMQAVKVTERELRRMMSAENFAWFELMQKVSRDA